MNPAIATTFKANGVAVSLAGGSHQFFNQAIGVVVHGGFAGGASVILDRNWWTQWSACAWTRKTKDAGLDLSQHGERAYK